RVGQLVGVPHPVTAAGRAHSPMSDISPSLHVEVVFRAGNRCEYCRLPQLGQEAAFHIDHVIPRAAGGPTVPKVAANKAIVWVDRTIHPSGLVYNSFVEPDNPAFPLVMWPEKPWTASNQV